MIRGFLFAFTSNVIKKPLFKVRLEHSNDKASAHVRVRRRCSCFDFLRDWVGVQCIACVAYAKRTSKGLSCAKAYFRERLTTRIRFLAGYKIEKNALDGCPGIEKEGCFQRRKAMGRYRL